MENEAGTWLQSRKLERESKEVVMARDRKQQNMKMGQGKSILPRFHPLSWKNRPAAKENKYLENFQFDGMLCSEKKQ